MNQKASQSPSTDRGSGGVQSVARAFHLLEIVATNGGPIGLSELASQSGLPLPTIHRVVRTLVGLGYLRQEPSRRYALGPRLMLLAEGTSTMLHSLATPHLTRLVDELGETANLAMLDGDQIVYIAQVPGRHSMRMFTEVGRRVNPHCTAVGKAILASSDPAEVRALLERTGMTRYTDHTVTTANEFADQLDVVRNRGYALDEQEQEVGVRCVAVALTAARASLAISVSGPAARMTDDLIDRAFPILSAEAELMSAELT